MLKFQPAISRPGSLVAIPHPVLVFRIQDAWDFERMKVPLRDGDQLAGRSRNGVEIVIEGQIGEHAGNLRLTEPEMLASMQAFRSTLDVKEEQAQYSLVVFSDDQLDDHRFFRSCTTQRCEFDLSSQHLYSFSLLIHASDPSLYSGSLPA